MLLFNPLKRALLLLLFPVSISIPAMGQKALDKLQPEEYFDFWVGRWELSWEHADGSVGKGSNRIEKILNGKVILENFEAGSGPLKGYKGKSFSVYEKRTGTWKQTWVDSEQGYIDLTGEFDGNKRIFKTEGVGPGGQKVLKRMVFYDIRKDAFTWDWEISADGGKTWDLQWRIRYTRKGE